MNTKQIGAVHTWVPHGFSVFFSYFVINFDSRPSTEDPSNVMKMNTSIIMIIGSDSLINEFKFENVEDALQLGNLIYFLFFKIS